MMPVPTYLNYTGTNAGITSDDYYVDKVMPASRRTIIMSAAVPELT
jgi:hypothetical protein